MNNFSKSILFSAALLISASVYSQSKKDAILMTVGNTKVTVGEFENVYHKNNSKETTDPAKALNDYLELYINFKMKVEEAKKAGLDTARAFIEELAGYRKQLAQPYLTDKDVNEKLLHETYDRLKEDIHASHILVKVSDGALPKDTLDAYNKIMKIRSRIMKGEDFNKVAMEKGISDDPSAKDNGGDLGYFTSMQMVYPFETAAYSTKVGEVSMPVRTRYGYHLIKVTDRRKSLGEVLVAHIMIKAGSTMSKEDSLNGYSKISEIYNKIKVGNQKFEELAQQYSDDKQSAKKGGELPWFGAGKMPAEFEKAAFGLKNKGDYSEIMQTKYGWHIIKLMDRRGLAPFDEMKNDLKAKVSKDSRSQQGRESLIAKVKGEYKFKENTKARDEFYKVIDSSFFEGKWDAAKAKALTKVMFNLNDKNFTQTNFADFLTNHQSKRPKSDVPMVINQMYKSFTDESVIAYEETLLDTKYPDFKSLMQEYRDGILLFQLTDSKVWSKAVKDTTGAKEYYEKNKSTYMWEERADATVYTCNDDKIAKQVRDLMKKRKNDKEIIDAVNKESQLNLAVESKLFTKSENEFVDKNWKVATTENIVSEKDKKVVIVVTHKIIAPTAKEFSEAKGLVTADYQNHLEKEWIKEMKAKYPANVDKAVLATIK